MKELVGAVPVLKPAAVDAHEVGVPKDPVPVASWPSGALEVEVQVGIREHQAQHREELEHVLP